LDGTALNLEVALQPEVASISDADDGGIIALEDESPTFALLQNYPNPFNPGTWLPFMLSEPAEVTISIYDIRGMLIRRLPLGYREAGSYVSKSSAAFWDSRDEIGENVSSGVYFYSIEAGKFNATRKLTIIGKLAGPSL